MWHLFVFPKVKQLEKDKDVVEGPSTQYLRSLVPKAIKGWVFVSRNLKDWVHGHFEGEDHRAKESVRCFFLLPDSCHDC